MTPPALARVLPEHLARLLQQAATTPVPPGYTGRRVSPREQAINTTTARLRREYPQFFKQEF
jgi:hypothetical protein